MTNIINKKSKIIRTLVLALIMLLTFGLTACDDSTELDYSDFSSDHLQSWEDVLTQEEDQYLLYYYGVNCSHCKTIKQDVLKFADYNQAELKVYFIDSAAVSYENYETYPINDPLTDLPVQGTPTIIVVNGGKAKAFAVGAVIIPDLLDQINKGTYGFIK